MEWLQKEHNIRKLFRIGTIFKIILAILQIISGFLIFIISQSLIKKWIVTLTQGELAEDSRDYFATHLLNFGTNFSLSSKLFIAIYLFSHGVIKFSLLYGVWKNKLIAYPLSAVAFSLFLLYQLYRYQFTHSIWLLILSVVDIVYITLILHEYKLLKKKNSM